MKITELSTGFINKLLATLMLLSCFCPSEAKIKLTGDREIAFKRASGLDNGISISWLEQTWVKGNLDRNVIKATDIKLLKQLGFKSIRLPIAFTHYQTNTDSIKKVLQHVSQILGWCRLYGFKLVICYHSGNLSDDNYLSETQHVIAIWSELARKYIRESPENLFFELYNEPPHMDPEKWRAAANNIITSIRKIDKKRTLIVGASNFNSIYELSRTTPLNDDNIIYTYHFYEPFFFTHQGAAWIGDQVSTTGVPFPYNAAKFPPLNPKAKGNAGEANYNKYNRDGNEQSVRDKLQIVKNWALKYNVPVLCGEYGVYNQYANRDSRCRYVKAVRQTLKTLSMPGMLWDYNTNFSIFDGKPNISNLPDCMRDAIGYNTKK